MPKLLNKYQVAEKLGMTWHNVRKLMQREENPMPYYKRVGKYIVYKTEFLIVPKSVGTDRLVFVESEILEWFKN